MKSSYVTVALNILFILGVGYVGLRSNVPAASNQGRVSYKVGDRLDIPAVQLAGAKYALVGYVPTGYMREPENWGLFGVISETKRDPSQWRFIMLTNKIDELRAEMASAKLAADDVARVAIAETGITMVPSMFLINSTKEILRMWRGMPRKDTWATTIADIQSVISR